MKVNPTNVAGFLRQAFSLKKTRNVGAVGRASFKFTVTLNARRILPEKTQGFWGGVGTTPIFLENHSGAVGLVSFKFTVKLNANRTLCGIYNGFSGVGGGLGRGCTLIWNRDGLWHLWPQRKPRLFGEDVDLDEKVKKV